MGSKEDEKSKEPTNWEKWNTISNVILTTCTVLALIFAVWGTYIANEGVKNQIELYQLEITPRVTMLVDFDGDKFVDYSSNMD